MWRPVVVLVLLAPVLGEVLSTATAPLTLLLPWNLALLAALYGGGALVCRELAVRCGRGLPALILLGAAYGVFEEALVDRFWFDPSYWHETGVGRYGEVWHTNVLLAGHLTLFHATVSVGCSVLVTEWLCPSGRGRRWLGRRGLVVAALAPLAALAVTFADYVPPRPAQTVVAALVVLVLGAAAFRVPTLAPRVRARRRPLVLGVVAFTCTGTQFALTYAVPSTSLPWPLGTVLALLPAAVGVAVVRWLATGDALGADALTVVTGIVSFFAVLDVAVGLFGRYDLTLAGLLLVPALWWLRRHASLTAGRGRRTSDRRTGLTGPA